MSELRFRCSSALRAPRSICRLALLCLPFARRPPLLHMRAAADVACFLSVEQPPGYHDGEELAVAVHLVNELRRARSLYGRPLGFPKLAGGAASVDEQPIRGLAFIGPIGRDARAFACAEEHASGALQ